VELYTHYTCVQDLIRIHLEKTLDVRLCCVHLIDSVHCCSSTTFLSAVLLVAMTMLRLALPHVSVLSKVDLLARQYKDSCPFNIDFYTECLDLAPLTRFVDRPFSANYDDQNYNDDESDSCSDVEIENSANGANGAQRDGIASSISGSRGKTRKTDYRSAPTRRFEEKHREMTAGLCELLTDYGMVSFSPCSIEDGEVGCNEVVHRSWIVLTMNCLFSMFVFVFC
jgi:hypothetical protein